MNRHHRVELYVATRLHDITVGIRDVKVVSLIHQLDVGLLEETSSPSHGFVSHFVAIYATLLRVARLLQRDEALIWIALEVLRATAAAVDRRCIMRSAPLESRAAAN